MDKMMLLDAKTKNRIGIICFLPLVCFLACFAYYLMLILPILAGPHEAGSISSVTSAHYDTMLLMLGASAIITAPVFIYCLVLLARFKNMNAALKLQWFIFLCVIAPVASVLFWTFLIKDAPRQVDIYPDIA